MSNPHATVRIEQVYVNRGDTLTIYANHATRPDYKTTQIELRITHAGKLEVFCDKELDRRPFTEWRPL